MEQLNTMKFISNAAERLTEHKERIKNAENYEKAREAANAMLGYIDCLNTFNSTMVCMENNGFTAEFYELLTDWHEKTCQALIDKAIETEQSQELIRELMGIRCRYKNNITEETTKHITEPADTELKKWADRAVRAAKEEYILNITDKHGIYMSLIGRERILVFGEIYRLAHIPGVKVKERYEPEEERKPFIYEFEYRGIKFLNYRAEHITVPEEYSDAKFK